MEVKNNSEITFWITGLAKIQTLKGKGRFGGRKINSNLDCPAGNARNNQIEMFRAGN